MCLSSHCCHCLRPVNSNHGFNLQQNGGHFDMGSFPRPLTYGGPSEKFVGVLGGNFQKLPPNFSEVAFMWKLPDATRFGATS